MFGCFLPSLWSSSNHSLFTPKEPTLLCNQLLTGFPLGRSTAPTNCQDKSSDLQISRAGTPRFNLNSVNPKGIPKSFGARR